MQCPTHAFLYNGTLCACNPGFFFNLSSNTCHLFAHTGPALQLNNGVDLDSTFPFPETIFAFDSIKKFTQSQAVFLEATSFMLLSWLGFCLFLRFFSLGSDGRSLWFKIRWWISRLDISFATRHWLQDQNPVLKRKTELGGTFSIASWILFIGLFAALLYQIISKRSVEVHNVRATNAPDLASFSNDLEFNITTISSMSCAQLRGLGTLVTGNPAFIDHRVLPLSAFANYSCVNTTSGPTITLKCNSCQFITDIAYVPWQFVDLPNSPATAVGFQFNLTAKSHVQKKHLSFVSGILKNASNSDDRPITYRGLGPNILKFNLFPRIYHNLHDLKLIQPLFHEFLPGSYFDEVSQLQASLSSSNNGLINTTLYINFLSSYIVEIDNQNILGPGESLLLIFSENAVSFLADLGGLYCISIGIFFYLLVQCEYRIKRLRNEDSVMRSIRNRRKAQDRWEKLRKYVRFTWGSCSLDDNYGTESKDAGCTGVMMKSFNQSGSSHGRRPQKRMDAVSFSKKVTLPNEKKAVPEHVHNQEVKEVVHNGNVEHNKDESSVSSPLGVADLPQLPPLELRDSSEMSMSDIQKKLEKLYEYNVMLREKLIHVLEEKGRQ
ncbi:hypothetical protein BUALT_Bualt01G0117100 [Buddleja alternifolia]|uniref:Uncharacterized protein n=1 Tax=Buddleja alternifolia TaxID=168488 RepID=A0AAV6Y6E9_9LAMI|nr:hypothetical protein BUALT_Bualt01G0117100 [Buddleja alternifolia]